MNALARIEDDPKPWLEMPDGMTFDEWVRLGRRLCASSQVVNWYIGDWWAFGEQRYGERAAAAAEGVFGKTFGSLRNTAVVCRAFETSRRHDALSFSHHQEVASLPPEDADALLTEAETRGWSKAELREQVISYRVMNAGLVDQAAQDPDFIGRLSLIRLWNRSSEAARIQFLKLATKARSIEIRDDFSRDRWSDDEIEKVRRAVVGGNEFDAVRAMFPRRSAKSVMWVYYAQRALLEEEADGPIAYGMDRAELRKSDKERSRSLYIALLKHHPEMVIAANP